MKQLNLIAVPNGTFTLDQIIASDFMKETIHELHSHEAPEDAKIKTFLAMYQMIDTLAQIHSQGFDLKDVNMDGLRKNMKTTIDLGYDSIMNTFTHQEQKKIRELVKKPTTTQ